MKGHFVYRYIKGEDMPVDFQGFYENRQTAVNDIIERGDPTYAVMDPAVEMDVLLPHEHVAGVTAYWPIQDETTASKTED